MMLFGDVSKRRWLMFAKRGGPGVEGRTEASLPMQSRIGMEAAQRQRFALCRDLNR